MRLEQHCIGPFMEASRGVPPWPLFWALALAEPLPVDTVLATAEELPSCCGVMAGAGGAPVGDGGATCGLHQ